MDDLGAVQGVQAGGDLGDDPHHLGDRERPLILEPAFERPTPHERHREVRAAVDLAGVEDRDEVLVADLARGSRLVHEAATESLVARQLRPQHLEGHLLSVGLAHGVEHQTDRALTELLLQPVRAQTTSRLDRSLARHAASISSREDAAALLGVREHDRVVGAGTMCGVTDHADRIEKLSERIAAAKEFL